MQERSHGSALILGVCILLGLALLGYLVGSSALKIKEFERSVTVKGLSEREYPADIVIWPIHFSAADNNLPALYASMEKDAAIIKAFLQDKGFSQEEISTSPPQVTDKLAQGYERSRIEFRYSASQAMTVYSRQIEEVRSTMNTIADIGKQGVALTSGGYQASTEYLFTRLNEVKPDMVEEATNKAREVAQKFAQDSNSRLGKIKRARQGQFSISSRDKNNPHIKKVRVVSTIEYYLSD